VRFIVTVALLTDLVSSLVDEAVAEAARDELSSAAAVRCTDGVVLDVVQSLCSDALLDLIGGTPVSQTSATPPGCVTLI
jgi:hypothetical protein